jgi:hypothetical protein
VQIKINTTPETTVPVIQVQGHVQVLPFGHANSQAIYFFQAEAEPITEEEYGFSQTTLAQSLSSSVHLAQSPLLEI